MNKAEWILIDTETTGFKAPIFAVELAAQRMQGWEADGEPFRRLLNHNEDIPPEASRVNGYTREILERDGDSPVQVYADFAEYVQDAPITAYNVAYDLDKVLYPEWKRMGVEQIGQRGFCALQLTQRLLDPVPAGNHKLQTLRQYYRLPERGAHTALGDVETVADLLQKVLRPLAEQRGLHTWEDLVEFAAASWYPSRIAFGKFKGRQFREALNDPDLRGWLEWLAEADNPRSAEMGKWYLRQLEVEVEKPSPGGFVIDAAISESSDVVIFKDPEIESLRQLIAAARDQLAELEADYTGEHHGVSVIRSQLFSLLREHYQHRDELRLVVDYRRKFIETLMVSGDEEAEELNEEFANAQEETEQEYEEAAVEAQDTHELSEDEKKELKTTFRKLLRTYHPDRYANDPEKQEVYTRLMSEINTAKDRGDIARLREIADDPEGFLVRQGWGTLDFEDGAELSALRRHYNNLQARILDMMDSLTELRESGDYELYQLSRKQPGFIQELAEQQSEDIKVQIRELEEEASELAEEIENLTGESAPFG